MKTTTIVQKNKIEFRARRYVRGGFTAAVATFFGALGVPSISMAQEGYTDVQGVEVLTRGPIHEAFAGIVTYDPIPGVMVQKAPPALIEEVPPSMRPEGNNITWIPGYWGWDDERTDYLWVSGTWRALPPGRQWMAGYWGETTQGHQWTSGYWADATLQETTYLPAPPATVEYGPSTRAPSRDHGWTPGNWMWRQDRYAWSPGYWAQGRADWDWVPAHYVWTPRGHIFVNGYWDYSVERRGTLFAPVHFDSRVYSLTGYSYSPSIVVGLAMFAEHLFLRPKYHHYYFGDYYANSYQRSGYHTAYSYQRYGYDPIYSRQRWEHRDDQTWERRRQESYIFRRDHENERPPHTWTAMRRLERNTLESQQTSRFMAAPLEQIAQRQDRTIQYRSVAQEDRTRLTQRSHEMRKTISERRTIESHNNRQNTTEQRGDGARIERVKQLDSPIVAMPVREFEKSQAPPTEQRAPQSVEQQTNPDPNARPPKIDERNPLQPDQPQPRTIDPTQPRRVEESPHEPRVQPERPRNTDGRPMQPAVEPPTRKLPDRELTPSERVENSDPRLQPTPEPRVRETPRTPSVRETEPRMRETPAPRANETPRPPSVREAPTPRVRETPSPSVNEIPRTPNVRVTPEPSVRETPPPRVNQTPSTPRVTPRPPNVRVTPEPRVRETPPPRVNQIPPTPRVKETPRVRETPQRQPVTPTQREPRKATQGETKQRDLSPKSNDTQPNKKDRKREFTDKTLR